MRLPHVLGNEGLKQSLSHLPAGGLGSAILLDGPAGSGKRTAARDLSQALLCSAKDAPCGVCPACRRIAAGSHPDLLWLEEQEPGKGYKLEQIRALRAQSFLRPSEAPYKIFIIPQADRLNLPSQNALLKVLEEPASSLFILLCENREAMLQTVRSRCKTFRMAPLSTSQLLSALKERCPEVPDTQRKDAAMHSAGLLGRALDTLSGKESPALAAAQDFCNALSGDELRIFTACQGLLKLSRSEYAAFCDESCRLLLEQAKQNPNSRSILIFDYLEQQRDMLVQNPSVTALSGALAAFCSNR